MTDVSCTPEGKLWCAVILQAWRDAKSIFAFAKGEIDARGRLSAHTRTEFKKLHRELLAENFGLVCGLVDVSSDRFLKSFYSELDQEGLRLSDFYDLLSEQRAFV